MKAEVIPFTPKGQTQVPASESTVRSGNQRSHKGRKIPRYREAQQSIFTEPVPVEENSSSRYYSRATQFRRRFQHTSNAQISTQPLATAGNYSRETADDEKLPNCLPRVIGKRTWTTSGSTRCNPLIAMLPSACSLKTLMSCEPL